MLYYIVRSYICNESKIDCIQAYYHALYVCKSNKIYLTLWQIQLLFPAVFLNLVTFPGFNLSFNHDWFRKSITTTAGLLKYIYNNCNDVQIEPVLQEINGEALNSGSNKSPDARLDVHARGFGRDKDLHSLMSGYVTQMQSPTEI